MAERSTDARDADAAPPVPPRPDPTPSSERTGAPADEAEKARTDIAAGDVADDLADFA